MKHFLHFFKHRNQREMPSSEDAVNLTAASETDTDDVVKSADIAYADAEAAAESDDDPAEPLDDTPVLSFEETVVDLRNKIIAALKKRPCTEYELGCLLWGDASRCFPVSASFSWDNASLKLDLKTRKLYVKLSTYPNHLGACRESTEELSPSEFHQLLTKHHIFKSLLVFQTREDWDALFDDDLKAAVTEAVKTIEAENERRYQEERRNNAVRISNLLAQSVPAMDISKLEIKLDQAYATSTVRLTIDDGKYFLWSCWESKLSASRTVHHSEPSQIESVWIEGSLNYTLLNSDNSTRESLIGGDMMTVNIIRGKKKILLEHVKPIIKYSELKNQLQTLAEYGSIIE